MAQSSGATVTFIRGDDFFLTMAVTDLNSAAAVTAQSNLTSAQQALDADPSNPTLIAARDAAQTAYDAAIIVDITGWTIRSMVRKGRTFTAELTVTVIDATLGQFSIAATPTLTETWRVATHTCDVQFDIPATGRTTSQSFDIVVCEDVTYDD